MYSSMYGEPELVIETFWAITTLERLVDVINNIRFLEGRNLFVFGLVLQLV